MEERQDGEFGGIGVEVEKLKSSVAAIIEKQKPRLRAEAKAIRARISEKAKLSRRNALRMAENLHAILEELTASGEEGAVTKSAIVEKAAMADGDGKTRILYDYTFPPGLDNEAANRRRGRISCRAGSYLRLVHAAAVVAGRDEDGLVVRLAEGTSLASGLADLPDDVQSGHLDLLTEAIRGEARRITKVLDLEWYFSKVDGHSLIDTGTGWMSDRADPLFVAALPTVWLWTEEEAEFDGIWHPKGEGGNRPETERRTALLCSRLGLTVAPFGRERAIVPCFFRKWCTVLVGDRRASRPSEGNLAERGIFLDLAPRILLRPPMKGCDRIVGHSGVFLPTNRAALVRILDQFNCQFDGSDEEEFFEVTPSSLAVAVEKSRPEVDDEPGDKLMFAADTYTKASPDSRLARLEIGLLHGCGPEEARLGEDVETAAAASVASLKRWIAEQDTGIEDALSSLATWEE